MDIPRKKKKSPKKYVLGGVVLAAAVGATFGLSRLSPAAPSVDRVTLFRDVVRRGTLIRKVRGPGTLVPEEIRWISALTAGRVDRKLVEPGTVVEAATVLLELSNPDVELELLNADRQVAQAENTLAQLETDLESQRLQLEASIATTRAQFLQAQRNLRAAEQLALEDLASEEEINAARESVEETETRLSTERRRLENLANSIPNRINAQNAEVTRLRAIASFQRGRRASMLVRAGVDGVLQELSLEEGQWVQSGTLLAKVVQPGRLKAVLRIPETQARDIVVGQLAIIDTRNDTIIGRVVRIDPAATQATVGVDVSLPDSLPRSARPDLTVEGMIEIERLVDVMYTGRPAFGQANSMVGLFKVLPNISEAIRTTVRLGSSSVSEIQIISGLEVGDTVILSDMSAWDAVDRVRLR